MLRISLLLALSSLSMGPLVQNKEENPLLSKIIHIKIYPSETLESVLLRISLDYSVDVRFSTQEITSYKAEPGNFTGTSLETLLQIQLADKPIRYHVERNQLVLTLPKRTISRQTKN